MASDNGALLAPDDSIDLHMHTVASDGRWTPEQLVNHLHEEGFRVFAVADHDSMDSVAEVLRLASERDMHAVPAVEMTTRWEDRQVHCLIYGVEMEATQSQPFMELLADQQQRLLEMSDRIMALLEQNGRHIRSLDEVLGGRPVKPYMVYRAMIRDGHGTDLRTAHNIVKGLGEPGLVDVPLADTVAAAHRAGAFAIVAHPGRDDGWGVLKEEHLQRMLAEIPIDGVEAHYRSYKDEDTRYYRDWAEQNGLVVSAGSDSHWPKFPVDPIHYPARWVEGLLGKLGYSVDAYDGPAWVPTEPAAASSGGSRDSSGG